MSNSSGPVENVTSTVDPASTSASAAGSDRIACPASYSSLGSSPAKLNLRSASRSVAAAVAWSIPTTFGTVAVSASGSSWLRSSHTIPAAAAIPRIASTHTHQREPRSESSDSGRAWVWVAVARTREVSGVVARSGVVEAVGAPRPPTGSHAVGAGASTRPPCRTARRSDRMWPASG